MNTFHEAVMNTPLCLDSQMNFQTTRKSPAIVNWSMPWPMSAYHVSAWLTQQHSLICPIGEENWCSTSVIPNDIPYVGNFRGYKFSRNRGSEIFAVGESVTLAVRLKAERMFKERDDNLSSLFQCGEKTSLVPRTLVYRNVDSAFGLAPPCGSCVCACN